MELAFYVTIGILYFPLGWKRSVLGLIVIWVVASTFRHVPLPIIGRAAEPLWWAGAKHFGWFASGALFYKAHENRSPALFSLAIFIALLCSLTNFLVVQWHDRAALVAIVALFAASQKSIVTQRLLASRSLFFVGTVSYPLYLLHNHFGLAVISYLGVYARDYAPLVPVLVIGFLILASYNIHGRFEPWATAWLR